MVEIHPALLVLTLVLNLLLGFGFAWGWGSRDRELAKQFIRAKIVVAHVDEFKTVPYEIWEAVAPHERD
jgi:hypothetical protein